MTWADESQNFTSKPIVVMTVGFDSGTLKLSNRDVEIIDGGFYEGRVLTFGSLSRSITNVHGEFQIGSITSSFSNNDGTFSLLDMEKFLNRQVIYKVGYTGLSINDFETVFTGIIDDFKYNETLFGLLITDTLKKTLEKDFGHNITSGYWPNAPADNLNIKMPIIYGQITGEI